MKYFTKVGYTTNTYKRIPRWCTDMDKIDELYVFQKDKMKMNGDRIFGYLDPRNTQCDLRDIFKGNVNIVQGSRR